MNKGKKEENQVKAMMVESVTITSLIVVACVEILKTTIGFFWGKALDRWHKKDE
jgi:hypothetical protein